MITTSVASAMVKLLPKGAGSPRAGCIGVHR